MKKLLATIVSIFLIVGGSCPVFAEEKEDLLILNAPTSQIAMQRLNDDPDTVKTSLTEEEFVKELKNQGYQVKKIQSIQAYDGEARASTYKVSRPLTRNGAPSGSGAIPGNHYFIATYNTFSGWNYFVQFISAGVELMSSSYGKESEQSSYNWTYGGQGVTWYTTLQYTYTTSQNISLSGGWFSVGAGSSYIYRTSIVTESNSFNFPIVG